MRQRFCSVLTSYSSPTETLRAALAEIPLNFTLPLSQASAASVRVLNRRMDQRYLSRRIFSLEGIFMRGGWAGGQNYLNCWMGRISRRKFIGFAASAAVLAGSASAASAASAAASAGKARAYAGKIGLQLYSVRDEMNRDAAGTLR